MKRWRKSPSISVAALSRLQRGVPDRKIKAFDLGLFEDFFQAFVTTAA